MTESPDGLSDFYSFAANTHRAADRFDNGRAGSYAAALPCMAREPHRSRRRDAVLALIPLVEKTVVPFVLSGTLGNEELLVPFEIANMESNAAIESTVTLAPQVDVQSIVHIDTEMPRIDEARLTGSLPTQSSAEFSLSGRTGALKTSLLAAYGGTPGTEKAVEEGLAWLARQQRGDGSWSLMGPFTNGTSQENKAAATAMALLAFAGAGHTHREGTHQAVVAKGLRFLRSKQDADGFFAGDAPYNQQMYAQAQATIVICELLSMSRDPDLRETGPASRRLR